MPRYTVSTICRLATRLLMVWGEIFLELGIEYLKRGYDHDMGGWRAADGDGELSCEGGR